jgi:hypothetical protein
MTAQEAKEHGFVDKIDHDDAEEEEEEEVGRMNLRRFRNSAQLFKTRSAKQDPPGTAGEPLPGTVTVTVAPTLQPAATVNQVREKPMEPIPNPDPPVPPKPDEAEVKRAATELYKAKLKRDQEIDEIVLAVRKRDKKDFGELAAKFKVDDKSPAEFSKAIVFSDAFKPFEVHGGVEVVEEPLDGVKGTPGFYLVNSAEYRALAERVNRGGRGSIPQRTEILLDLPFTIAVYRDSPAGSGFMNAASQPTSTGLTSIQKQPFVVELGVRPLMVKDLIAPGATGGTTVRYIRENAIPSYAGTLVSSEGAAKTEILFDYSEVDAPVRKIAAFVKVTDELFSDYLAVASYINQRLPYMVEREEENQLLNGTGVAPQMTGILNTAGILTQAIGADTGSDALYKAISKLRFTSFFEPDGIVINPTNWQTLRLAKDTAGQYLAGGPFTAAYGNGPFVNIESIWGKPVAITPLIAAGTALVGAFRLGAQYFQREGLTIDMTNCDQDDFVKNRMTIRAEERLALAVYRPTAFCTVTGLT